MGAHHLSHRTPRWIATTAAALFFAGCSLESSPPPAQSGLTTRVHQQAATVASAVAQAGASDERTPSAAKPDREKPAAEAARQPGDAEPATRPDPVLADLRIKRLVVSQGVEAREPIGAGESFTLAEIERLYAFVEVHNVDAAESEIFVTFEPERGPARGHVRLRVGATPRWRTWAYTRGVRSPGTWTAVVRNVEGELLAKTTFVVESSVPAAGVPSPAEQAAVDSATETPTKAPAKPAATG